MPKLEIDFMYKLVNEYSDGTFESCCPNPLFPPKFVVQYKIGEFVYPTIENTKLFVFDSLENAKNLYKALEARLSIWKCEALNPKKAEIIGNIFSIETFWKYFNNNEELPITYTMKVPDGTYMCDAIKLTERVL